MMFWGHASLLLFGSLVVLMALGLPVAFAFLAINIVGAIFFLGGEPGLAQLARNAVVSVSSFSLTPIPFFMLMGEVLFHTGVAMKAIDAIALIISPGMMPAMSSPEIEMPARLPSSTVSAEGGISISTPPMPMIGPVAIRGS